MDDQLIKEIQVLHERVCGAFQDAKRLMILYAIAQKPRYVNELVEMLGLPQSTVSRHLKVLRDHYLVTTERDAQTVYYSLRTTHVITVLDAMRELLRDVLRQDADLLGAIDE